MQETIRELSLRKLMHCSRMMEAVLSKELGIQLNRKLVQIASTSLDGLTMPQDLTKHKIIRSVGDRIQKLIAINQACMADGHDLHMVWNRYLGLPTCLFSVLDVFFREYGLDVFHCSLGRIMPYSPLKRHYRSIRRLWER